MEEVKLVLKPHYNKKHINKEEYKDILRRAVPKVCWGVHGGIVDNFGLFTDLSQQVGRD